MDPFITAIDGVIGREGRYSNDQADRGGETMWGITSSTARAAGYAGPMAEMPRDTAVTIYRQRYWTGPALDRLAAIDQPLAVRLLDIGVNMGPPVGIGFLQRALNALNRGGVDYPDIATDGVLGSVTLGALQALLARRGDDGRRCAAGKDLRDSSAPALDDQEAAVRQCHRTFRPLQVTRECPHRGSPHPIRIRPPPRAPRQDGLAIIGVFDPSAPKVRPMGGGTSTAPPGAARHRRGELRRVIG